MKVICKFSLAVALFLLLCPRLHAFSVEVYPEEVAPGDVFLLKITTGDSPVSAIDFPKAGFSDMTIDFHQDGDKRLIAMVPVDIETAPKDYTIVISVEGKKITAGIRIKKHEFPVKRLTLPEEKVILSPENLKRAAREAELLKSILSRHTGRAWNGPFITPTDTGVSEVFGVKRIMNEKHTSVHRGTDYRGQTGTPVKALNAGEVVLREDFFFGGNTVVIDHGMGLYSIYMHLSELHVTEGEKVSKAQTIGLVGMTGRATGPHLHLGVKLLGVNVNPESLFRLEL